MAVTDRGIELSAIERTTRRMVRDYRATRGLTNCTAAEQTLLNLFEAFAHHAYPLPRLQKLADAMSCFESLELRPALRLLTRAKFLRARVSRGVRLYEVNY